MAALLGVHGGGWRADWLLVCDDVGVSVTDQHPADQDSTHGEHSTHRVDPDEEPSAAWGWHGTPQRAGKIAGWFTAFALFAMLLAQALGGHPLVATTVMP